MQRSRGQGYAPSSTDLVQTYVLRSTHVAYAQEAMPHLSSAVRSSGCCGASPYSERQEPSPDGIVLRYGWISASLFAVAVVRTTTILAGKPNPLWCARVLRARGELLHPSLDDAEPALGGRLPAYRQKRFAPEGMYDI